MRAGIFQCEGGGLTPEARLERLAAALAANPVDLVVCPELFMSGYDIGSELEALAEPCDGPFAKRVSELARRANSAIVYGYPERDGEHLYNAAACVDGTGGIISNHRKLMLPPGFEADYFMPGDGLTLFNHGSIRCAILICYDAEYPEAVRAAAEAGAEIVLVPTALGERWASVADKLIPTRAFENGVWLVYANHAGTENGSRYLGGSCIIAPDGSDAVRAGADEVLISAEVDVDQVTAAQARLPYLQGAGRLRNVVGKQL